VYSLDYPWYLHVYASLPMPKYAEVIKPSHDTRTPSQIPDTANHANHPHIY
jgi:hypothetical protein